MTNVIEFTNNIGQVIRPGDEVVIVTTGYSHSVSTAKATYLGMHKNGGAQCMKQVKTTIYVFKDSGERVPNEFFMEMQKASADWTKEFYAKNPLNRNFYKDPEYKALRDQYMDQIEVKSIYVDRRTTLKLNRIFKLAAA
jgi:hypothetical protein